LCISALARFIAHQALLTDRVLNASGGDWGICEISLFSGDRLMSQLRQQDHLFTVLEKGAEATSRLCRRRSRMPECKAGLAGRHY
jgi:mannitol-1-phosphate/altronate dehydrogenase